MSPFQNGMPGARKTILERTRSPLRLLRKNIAPFRSVISTSAIARGALKALSSPGRKASALAVCLFVAWTTMALSSGLISSIPLVFAMWIVGPPLTERLRTWLMVRHVETRVPLHALATQASEVLRAMGVNDTTTAEIMSRTADGEEVRLGRFDQGNRLLSDIGSIPLFGDALIGNLEFQPRARQAVELVATTRGVAIKKSYSDSGSFFQEVAALSRLSDVKGVPKIVRIDRRHRVLYQTFLVGRDLGSLMAKAGFSVGAQHSLCSAYPGIGAWDATSGPQNRTIAVNTLQRVTDSTFARHMEVLIESIHQSGVVIGDVKFGNVIITSDGVCLCDFDHARIFPGITMSSILARERDRDLCNYIFGSALLVAQAGNNVKPLPADPDFVTAAKGDLQLSAPLTQFLPRKK